MAGEAMMAGSMFGPQGAAVGGALDAVKTLTGGAAAPSRAESMQSNGYGFDNSGWSVATGGGTASTAAGLTMPSWGIPAILAFGLLVWLKSRKS